jgi:nucleoside-diphosphate-sugar epimerase
MYVVVTGGSGFIGSDVVDRPLIFDPRRSPYHPGVDSVTADLADLDTLYGTALAARPSTTDTWAAGARARMASAGSAAGRSWPAPMSAVRMSTRVTDAASVAASA